MAWVVSRRLRTAAVASPAAAGGTVRSVHVAAAAVVAVFGPHPVRRVAMAAAYRLPPVWVLQWALQAGMKQSDWAAARWRRWGVQGVGRPWQGRAPERMGQRGRQQIPRGCWRRRRCRRWPRRWGPGASPSAHSGDGSGHACRSTASVTSSGVQRAYHCPFNTSQVALVTHGCHYH